MVRLFVPLPDPSPSEVTLSGERRHYLLHVLRLGEGAVLEVFDGSGRAHDARVVAVEQEGVRLALGEVRRAPASRAVDRKSTRLNSSHSGESRMPSSA